MGNELFKLERIETRLLLCNRHLIRFLQVVVHRIFPYPAVKLIPFQFLLEQRILHIVKNDTLIIKGKDFVFVSAHIYRIAEMIGVVCFLLRLSFSRLRRFQFGWSRVEDFTVSLFFGKFRSAFLLLLEPLWINLFFLWIEITVEAYQLGNPLFHLSPIQPDMRLVIANTF